MNLFSIIFSGIMVIVSNCCLSIQGFPVFWFSAGFLGILLEIASLAGEVWPQIHLVSFWPY